MRKVIMSAVIAVVVLAWSGMARAQAVDAAANVAANVAVNNGMQFHNGHWWYWSPQNSHWMVHHNNQWIAPNAQGQYLNNGVSIWAQPYSTGYRGTYYGNNNNYNYNYNRGYYDPGYGYYGNNYYGNRSYGGYRGYGAGGYGYGNRGANIGAQIGGALGGGQGANIGAAIGGAIR